MVATFFHQPFGGTGCPTDTYRLGIGKPIEVYLLGIFHMITVGVYGFTLVIEHLSIAALSPTHKNDHIMLGCKARNVGHTVGHLSANGVETAKNGRGTDVRLYVFDDAMELVKALRGLRIEVDVAIEIELWHLVEMLYHDGLTARLPHKTKNLGVSVLPKDHDLCIGVGVELLLDAVLQL